MLGGFSFCGVDIDTIGLHYAPDLPNTYVFKESAYNPIEQTFNSHDGGYYYGTSVQPKTFTLRCFFEDSHINNGILYQIGSLFKRGKTGKLVFKTREWLWYNATVTNVDYSGLTNYMNGIITISMKAYYPYAISSFISVPEQYEHFLLDNSRLDYDKLYDDTVPQATAQIIQNIVNNSGVVAAQITPSTIVATPYEPLTTSKNIILYNGGTQNAPVKIKLSGNAGEGIEIINHTTGQKCKFIAFTKALTSDDYKYLLCDAINGKTLLIGEDQTSQYAFIYHDGGFISLVPSYPIKRGVAVNVQNGSPIVYFDDVLFDDIDGQFIDINNIWYKILSHNGNAAVLDEPVEIELSEEQQEETVQCITNIVQMNEIQIVMSAGAELDHLQFIYNATFA